MRIELAAWTCVLVSGLVGSALAADAAPGAGVATVIDSGAISGLGARNIGSASMSGRISALAGYTDRPVKSRCSSERRAEECGSRPTVARLSNRSSMSSRCSRSERLRSIPPIRRMSGWAPARLDTQQRVNRQWHLQVHGRRRDLDARGPARLRAHLPDHGRPALGRYRLCLRARQAVERLGPARSLQDHRRRHHLAVATEGFQSIDRLRQYRARPTRSGGAVRKPVGLPPQGWTFRSGGDGPTAPSGSGLYRTADGGKSWTQITPQANKGFLPKPYGRIALALAPSDSNTVYAFVESTDSALLISHDGGTTWERGDKSQWMVWRPFYFAKLIVDRRMPPASTRPTAISS